VDPDLFWETGMSPGPALSDHDLESFTPYLSTDFMAIISKFFPVIKVNREFTSGDFMIYANV